LFLGGGELAFQVGGVGAQFGAAFLDAADEALRARQHDPRPLRQPALRSAGKLSTLIIRQR